MKTIALIVNFQKEGARDTALRLISALRGRADMYCDKAAEGLLPLTALPDRELFAKCPTVVTLGGDGTIINAAGRCAPYGNILLGINSGRLGFLATLEANPPEAAAEFILSDFTWQERTMLKCQVLYATGEESVYHALNDVVLSRGTGRMTSVSAFMGNRLITRVRADGIVVATPTGSTAYSLSAGGPLAAPDMDIFLLSPICPHNLSARSIILPADRSVILEADGDGAVSVDGQSVLSVRPGDKVQISKSPYVTRLAMGNKADFYELVRKKLIQPLT